MSVDVQDVSGTPRSIEDIKAALRCIQTEIVKNPTAMSKEHGPLLLHYVVIIEVLRAELGRRT